MDTPGSFNLHWTKVFLDQALSKSHNEGFFCSVSLIPRSLYPKYVSSMPTDSHTLLSMMQKETQGKIVLHESERESLTFSRTSA